MSVVNKVGDIFDIPEYLCLSINIFEYICLDSSCSYIHRMDCF